MSNSNEDKGYDYESVLYDNNIVSIHDEFDGENCAEWRGKIISLDLTNEDNKPIILLIDSLGGGVYSALGLIDVIRGCKSPVYTVCTGIAASCGANLLVAGDKRFATKNSSIMIHQIYTSMENIRVNDIDNERDEMKRLHQTFIDLYMEKTGMSKLKIEKIHRKDSYMSAQEALKLNIIDEIGWNIHDWIK